VDSNIEVQLSNRELANLFQVRQVNSDSESEEKYDIKNLSLVDKFDSQVEIVQAFGKLLSIKDIFKNTSLLGSSKSKIALLHLESQNEH
jgi:hypothetical protein